MALLHQVKIENYGKEEVSNRSLTCMHCNEPMELGAAFVVEHKPNLHNTDGYKDRAEFTTCTKN